MANAPGGPPQSPQVFYVQHPMPAAYPPPPPQSGTSVERVTVPLLLFVSSAAFVAWASWFGTTSINSIQANIREISVTLNNYIDQSSARVARIENVLEKRTAERWTKQDQALFCARTEAIAGNKGWKCAEPNGTQADASEVPIWEGVLERRAPVADIEDSRSIGRWSNPKVRATP